MQFPTDIPIRKMQGGGTVRTWDIPPEAERLSYYIRTNGRPLKALVELVRYALFLSLLVSYRFVNSPAPEFLRKCLWRNWMRFGWSDRLLDVF
jgi:hypothetical protein